MERRSNLMVLLGIAFFLIGGLLVFLVLRDSDDDSSAEPGRATIVVAKDSLTAGTFGDDLIAQELLETKTVDSASAPADAIASISQLSGTTLINAVDKGSPITFGNLTRDQLRAIDIPEGFDGVTMQLDFLSGGGGYVDPGDRINLYAVSPDCSVTGGEDGGEGCPYATPRVDLLLTNVLVLDVDVQIEANRGSGAASSQGPDVTTPDGNVIRRPQTDQVLYLLALTPEDAEKVIFQQEFKRMYVSIAPEDAPPAGPTLGQDPTTILSDEPNAAFERSNPDG